MKKWYEMGSRWFGLGFSSVLLVAGVQACSGGGPAQPIMVSNSSAGLGAQIKQEWFEQCASRPGSSMLQINGMPVCREQFSAPGTMQVLPFPMLNPENPNSPSAQVTSIQFFAGDTVTLIADGKQGRLHPFSCKGPDVSGYVYDSDQAEEVDGRDGKKAGLYGVLQFSSSRSTPFLIGSNYSLGTLTSDAILLVGWNPPAEQSPDCIELNYLQAQITRCVDATGKSYPCPY